MAKQKPAIAPRKPSNRQFDPDKAEAFLLAGEEKEGGASQATVTPLRTSEPEEAQALELQSAVAVEVPAAEKKAGLRPRAKGESKRQLTVYVRPEVAKKLRVQAARQDTDISTLVAGVLEAYVAGL